LPHPAAPAGHTARTQSNLYLSSFLSWNFPTIGFRYFPATVLKKILENIRNTARLHVPVSYIVDLNDWGDGAAAEASNLLNGELSFGIRILAFRDIQFTAESSIN
jgi:hypothetical protein